MACSHFLYNSYHVWMLFYTKQTTALNVIAHIRNRSILCKDKGKKAKESIAFFTIRYFCCIFQLWYWYFVQIPRYFIKNCGNICVSSWNNNFYVNTKPHLFMKHVWRLINPQVFVFLFFFSPCVLHFLYLDFFKEILSVSSSLYKSFSSPACVTCKLILILWS